MTPLDKLRDELAEKHAAKEYDADSNQADIVCCREDFKTGWVAALKALTDASGEMDVAAINESSKKLDYEQSKIHIKRHGFSSGLRNIYFLGAKFQFEQDRARIGLAELKASLAKSDADSNDFTRRDALERAAKLEARLAESHDEGYRAGLIDANADERIQVQAFKDKLAASEAERVRLTRIVQFMEEDAKGISE